MESIERLCALARLRLTRDELAAFESKFSRMLSFVEQVRSYEPESGGDLDVYETSLELRLDQPETFAWPQGQEHDYRVPGVIDFGGAPTAGAGE